MFDYAQANKGRAVLDMIKMTASHLFDDSEQVTKYKAGKDL